MLSPRDGARNLPPGRLDGGPGEGSEDVSSVIPTVAGVPSRGPAERVSRSKELPERLYIFSVRKPSLLSLSLSSTAMLPRPHDGRASRDVWM